MITVLNKHSKLTPKILFSNCLCIDSAALRPPYANKKDLTNVMKQLQPTIIPYTSK